ncbi:MAG: helix-turn-helix domain-containing protein [bacterium]|nr:helix-turn-helix domain-containing protein [bacterium]
MRLDELGGRIRWQRERLGLKQQDVANALQISPQAVSKWERGENAPDIAMLGPLARVLGVSVDWLLNAHAGGRDVLEATVFVSSVSGAYERSLQIAPREFAAWANGMFTQLTEAVLRHQGVPIKYMGDQFLGFFSGPGHRERACQAAFLAQRMVADALKVGLSTGDVYVGAVGHPDYGGSDIMGEAVNLAFLTKDWCEADAGSGMAATRATVEGLEEAFETGSAEEVRFKGIDHPVLVCELLRETSETGTVPSGALD